MMYDDNGHGTHIAGIIGGDGGSSGGRYMGIAPRCHFIIVKILDKKGNGNTENVVQAIDWLVRKRNVSDSDCKYLYWHGASGGEPGKNKAFKSSRICLG